MDGHRISAFVPVGTSSKDAAISAPTANRTYPLSYIKPLSPGRGILNSLETLGKTKHAAEQRKGCDEAILAGTVDNSSLVEHLRPRAV
jgi:hypothetical protein